MKGVNGHIIDGTSICVDYWLWTPDKNYLHFLTHLHADHTIGLKSSFRERIYTSPFNAWLLERWFKIDPEFIVPLTVGNSHVIYDENSESHFSVTLLDANHCPGSTMFLFQGSFGNILYTGDFRYHPDMLKHPMMKSVIENEAVHKLYMDNTFAAEHCKFPTRSQALKDLMTLIRNHKDKYVILGARKLGKEEVFKAVALNLKENILVSEERFKILAYLKYPNVFTTNGNEARIMVKEMHHITGSFLHQIQEEKGPTLTVLLTALYNINPANGSGNSKLPSKTPDVHHIPYSDHCCHSELLTFVSKVKPHRIYPIVLSDMTHTLNNNGGGDIDYLNSCYHLKNLSASSIIPQSIINLCVQPEPMEYKMSILKSKIKRDGKVGLSLQTCDKSRHAAQQHTVNGCEDDVSVSDQMECDVYSQDLESLSFVSVTADTTTSSLHDEYFSIPDEDITQQNDAVSKIAPAQPKLGTDDGELISIINGDDNIVDESEHSKVSSFLCNPIDTTAVTESNTSIQVQDYSCIDMTSDINSVRQDLCTILNKINDKIEERSPSTKSASLAVALMQDPSSPPSREVKSLTNISQVNFTYSAEESPSSTVKDDEILLSPSIISSSNQVLDESTTADKPFISNYSPHSGNQILPSPVFASTAMGLQGSPYINMQSDCNKLNVNEESAIDVTHSNTSLENHSSSTEPNSLIDDCVQRSFSSDLTDAMEKQGKFTTISQINCIYSDEESPSSTVEDNTILPSPSIVNSSNQMIDKHFLSYNLCNPSEENLLKPEVSSKNVSSSTRVSNCKSLYKAVSTEMIEVIECTEEKAILGSHLVNTSDESIKNVSDCVKKPAGCTLNKQCNNELNGNEISTKELLLSEEPGINHQSLKEKKNLLANKLPVKSDGSCVELFPDSSQLHSNPSSQTENNLSLLHQLLCVEKDKQDTDCSQSIIKLHPFYSQIKNIYTSWGKSVKHSQFRRHKLKKSIEKNHKGMWKDYNWKLLFKNENK